MKYTVEEKGRKATFECDKGECSTKEIMEIIEKMNTITEVKDIRPSFGGYTPNDDREGE